MPAFSLLHNHSILVSHQQSSIRKAQSRLTLPTFSSSISIKICPFDRSPVDPALLILMEDRTQQILVSWSCHVDESYLHLPSCFNIVGPNIASGHLKIRLLVSSSIFRTSVQHGRGHMLSHSRKCRLHPRQIIQESLQLALQRFTIQRSFWENMIITKYFWLEIVEQSIPSIVCRSDINHNPVVFRPDLLTYPTRLVNIPLEQYLPCLKVKELDTYVKFMSETALKYHSVPITAYPYVHTSNGRIQLAPRWLGSCGRYTTKWGVLSKAFQ